ncbi:MAG: rhombosortase [Steroidobacteraceae bacterium]
MTVTKPEPSRSSWSRSLNCDGRYGITLATLLALLLTMAAMPAAWQELLSYTRTDLAAGQLWRLLTAHLVHVNPRHALANCAGLALLWALFARGMRPLAWSFVVFACMMAIDAGLWLQQTQLEWYRGASGVLHGVLVAGAVAHLRRERTLALLSLALLCAKLAYEHSGGQLPTVGDLPVASAAHIYGAFGGLTAIVPTLWRNKRGHGGGEPL